MKLHLLLLTLPILSLATTTFGQAAKIEGYVSTESGARVAAVQIIVTPGGQTGTTDSKGHFTISLPKNVQPGQAARIRVDRTGWVIFNPMFGKCETQSATHNYEPLTVIIVPKGSPLSLSPKRLSTVITRWSAERVKLRTEVGQLKQRLDEYAFLQEYATEYGFSLDQFRAAADEWAQVKDSDDKEDRALKAYWQKNYSSAAQLAEESAQAADEELRQARQRTVAASLKLIRRYKLAGNAFYADYKFSEALAAYGEIEQHFQTRQISKEDLTNEWAEVKVLIGNTKYELGNRVEGAAGPRLLGEALAAVRQTETFYTRAQLPQQWAVTQNNLGVILNALGARAEGSEGLKYLNEAVVAYRAALEVYTRAQMPQDWAMTQNNLGNLLRALSGRVEGSEGLRYLNEAVVAFRAALEVYTRAQLPPKWAITQNNLGIVLRALSERAEGSEALKYLNEAVVAYRAALEVRTRAQLPQDWAATQNNLGTVLWALGELAEGSEGLKYLNEAVVAYRAALEVYTRAELPQQWALTQNNLGVILNALSARADGSEALKYLNEAVAAYRAALEVRTRAQLPQDWATTQNNLGVVLRVLGERAEGSEGLKYFNEAVATYRAALEVRTRAQLPQDWAMTQNNLGRTCLLLRDWTCAGDAYADVLQVYPDNAEAYHQATMLLHEKLFKFDQAFALHQQWLARHKDDARARSDFTETHLTTARFSECTELVAALLAQPKVSTYTKIALRAIEIASLLALKQSRQAAAKLDTLIAEVARQPPTFRVEWNFDGTRYFISHSEHLATSRIWLAQLLDALASKDRDTMLKGLQKARTAFKE